jgi:hypothetical protein
MGLNMQEGASPDGAPRAHAHQQVGERAEHGAAAVAAVGAGGVQLGGPHARRGRRAVDLHQLCNMIEAPWLVNGGHGASVRHHTVHHIASYQRRQRGGVAQALHDGGKEAVVAGVGQPREAQRGRTSGRPAAALKNVGESQ